MASSIPTNRSAILSTYRTLSRLIKNLPTNQKPQYQFDALQTQFRSNASLTEIPEIQSCLQKAGEQIAYLRIITPKSAQRSNNASGGSQSSSSDTKQKGKIRLIYTKEGVVEIKDGESGGQVRGANGRVVSNWDGKNLDPCSVKTHNSQLKRAGFANNLHAKGLF